MHSLLKLSFLATLFAGSLAAIPDKPGFKVIWSDDFNGEAGNQANKKEWNYELNGRHTNNELQTYMDSAQNSGLTGRGSLHITPQKSMGSGVWTSARIATWKDFTCERGYKMVIEAEIKLGDHAAINQKGIWPAFWALGTGIYKGVAWPACGEFDIMEVRNGEDKSLGTLHFGRNGHQSRGSADGTNFDRKQFHKWSIEINRQPYDKWEEQTIKWYVDGRNFQTIKGSEVGNYEDWKTLAHSPFYILLNVAVGGDFPGMPDTRTIPGEGAGMEVNYVAVYAGTEKSG
ncbi:glycoside hydrolase family 16 protein [Halenospora varia]|nr:glycoside hydrolase family 16 protein [Halenospora varia]